MSAGFRGTSAGSCWPLAPRPSIRRNQRCGRERFTRRRRSEEEMGAIKDKKTPSLLAVVVLLSELPAQRLSRGKAGRIVEQLDENISLVEFSGEQGRA